MPRKELEHAARELFAALLHMRRLDAGLDVRAVALALSCSPATVYALERGEREPGLGTLVRLRELFALGSIGELLDLPPEEIAA